MIKRKVLSNTERAEMQVAEILATEISVSGPVYFIDLGNSPFTFTQHLAAACGPSNLLPTTHSRQRF